jgi:hypothetical protein
MPHNVRDQRPRNSGREPAVRRSAASLGWASSLHAPAGARIGSWHPATGCDSVGGSPFWFPRVISIEPGNRLQ